MPALASTEELSSHGLLWQRASCTLRPSLSGGRSSPRMTFDMELSLRPEYCSFEQYVSFSIANVKAMHLVKHSPQLALIDYVFLVRRLGHQSQVGRASDVSQRVGQYRKAKKRCCWRLVCGSKACLLSVDEWGEVRSMIAGLTGFEYPWSEQCEMNVFDSQFPKHIYHIILVVFLCLASLRDVLLPVMAALGKKLCHTPRRSTDPVILTTSRSLRQPRWFSNT